jgi:FkbH-like protein
MKLIEALEIVRKDTAEGAKPFRVSLVCSFTPAHLQTFLHANLKLALPDRRIAIKPGLYGDFWGSIARIEKDSPDAAVLVLEWSDLDPRLGLRSLGEWSPPALEDILRNARSRAAQFRDAVERAAGGIPLAICFPTLPLPPVSYTPGWRGGVLDLALRAEISGISLYCAESTKAGVLNSQALDLDSALANRFDAKAELASGFPYRLPHASMIAAMLTRLIQPPAPKKGLITDLDDTVWSGILGEVGVEGVSWTLENHSHVHAVYQKMLHALSETGVLVGVASKNDGQLVEKALERSDMILPRKVIFPVEANWGPKSESVRKILKTWNVGEDSVAFVDDSPMELAEVKAIYPKVECLLFPKEDPQAIEALLFRLRDLFGKSALSEEDAIRRDSIIQAQSVERETESNGEVSEDFLRAADAEITMSFAKDPLDPRALDLVNKTNQFNLNGRRYAEKEWQDFVQDAGTVLLVVSYKDKYGPLGKIAVLAGRVAASVLTLDAWVMSCRAFSRRIEHRCLEELFTRFSLKEIVCDFVSTAKNGPIREFLTDALGHELQTNCVISQSAYMANRRDTFQKVLELTHG